MRTLRFPEIDAVFEDVEGAVRVTQGERSYLARKRQLNDRLESVIRTAVKHGYTCFWVEGHPSAPYLIGGDRYAKGSHHITFASSHQGRWLFVVGESLKPPVPREVTFTKGLRDFLQRINQVHTWEHSGGHNLCVPAEALDGVLSRLDEMTLNGLESLGRANIKYLGKGELTDIYNEDDLQSKLEATWRPAIATLGYSVRSRKKIDGYIPDIVLDVGKSETLIVELKYSHVGGAELDQLQNYLKLSTFDVAINSRLVTGVLIGRDFNPTVAAEAAKPGSRVCLYSFSQHSGGLVLTHVAGPRRLEAVKLVG